MKELREDRRPAEIRTGKWYRIIFDGSPHSFYHAYFYGLKAGNYAFFLNGKCVYVGQAKNLQARMRAHIRMMRYVHKWQTTWGQWFAFVVAIRQERYRYERFTLEARLIHRIKPLFNKQMKGMLDS